jgi:hypothetical protein
MAADRHKLGPIPYRPPAGTDLRDWLTEFAERSGRAVNAVITEALTEYRSAHDSTEGEDHDHPDD